MPKYADVNVGDQLPTIEKCPGRLQLVQYAAGSGDFNPLHHDDDYARASGLPSVMAHGMFSAGLLASFVTRWFGAGSVRRFKVRFRERVFPGDVLSAEGRVERVLTTPQGERRAELELRLLRQDGVPVILGSAEVALQEIV